MKKLILSSSRLGLVLGLLLSALSFSAFAQEGEQTAKNLYLAHARNAKRGRPGVKVTVELKRDGVSRKVPLNYSFRAGDKVKFHFETNFNAYVSVINVGSTGTLQLIYPYRGATELVAKTKDYAIPHGDIWLEFDNNPGKEQLTFIFSSQPMRIGTQTSPSAPRPAQGGTTANAAGNSLPSGSDQQLALAELNSSSLENGRDFSLVQGIKEDASYAYGVASIQTVRKPIGIKIKLQHE